MKQYERQNRPWLAGALVSVLIASLFGVALQFFKGEVLDSAIAGDGGRTLGYGLALAGFILGEILFYYLYRRLGDRFAAGCVTALKQDVFESVLRRDYVAFKGRAQGEYAAKYTGEADAIRARRFCMLPLFWEIAFKIVLVSGALFLLDWRVALLTIALLTTPLYIPKLIEKCSQRAQTAFLQASEEALSGVTDWLHGFELIKNFAVEDKILARFRRLNQNAGEKLLDDLKLGAAAQLITTLMSYLSYFIVLACSAWLVLRGDFSAGDFFVAIGMIDQLSYPIISLAGIVRQLSAIRPACRKMEEFIAEPPRSGQQGTAPRLRRDIRFHDVRFGYQGRGTVLAGFSPTLKKGGRYLLKGPSGCGKTTAVNLLLRYYEPDAGEITVDGAPLRQSGDPYARTTVVRQEAVLFRDTLRNNLSMYRPVPEDRLLDALHSVGLDRFASPDALDRMVEEGGANFSGGEKKRLCLARALLRDTDVLILDEPLANLDRETVDRIEDLLLAIRDRTVLVVSHQFSPGKLGAFDEVKELAAGA